MMFAAGSSMAANSPVDASSHDNPSAVALDDAGDEVVVFGLFE